jgi:hypothetical protein
MASVLRKLRVRFGSLVDVPANPEARVALFKFDNKGDSMRKIGRKMSRKNRGELKAAYDRLRALLDAVRGEDEEDDDMEKAHLPQEAVEYIEKLEADVAALESRVTELAAPADVSKAADLPEEIRKRIEDLEKRAADADARAADERDKRVTREWIEKAASLRALPVSAEEFGPVLKRFVEGAPTASDAEMLIRVLNAYGEQVEKGTLFAEVGKSSTVQPSAWDRIQALAKQLRDTDPQLTEAMAISKAAQLNPQLYAEYRAEAQ